MASPAPLVSIVVTTFNHARYLDAALASVKAQTVPADEVIVVDDGSTDDPAAVVAGHPGVILIRQHNQGLSAARNTGLAAARGRYVAFLDADDTLLPEMIETDLALFREHPDCAFVFGAYRLVDDGGAVIGEVASEDPGPDAYAGFLVRNLVGMHGTVLYRRDLALAAGGFDPGLRACEDYDLYLRLAREHPVAASERPLAHYRRHAHNMSNRIPRMYAAVISVIERHRETASTRPDWSRAFQAGIDYWTSHYSERQLKLLTEALKQRTAILPAATDFLRFARLAPRAAVRQARISFGLWRRRRRLMRRPHFGDLARVTPIDGQFGYNRGRPVDRRFIETFLAENAADIRGRVLEIGDDSYTRQFGGARVVTADVLNRFPGHPATTFVGDLAEGSDLPADAFDCIVLTQTLHLLFDMPSAVRTLHRILKPGGVLLVTVPWASPIDRGEWGNSWYWSVSPAALAKLLELAFDPADTRVTAYGNVQVATAFLYGLAEHELPETAYGVHDPHCPVIVAARAVKQGGTR